MIEIETAKNIETDRAPRELNIYVVRHGEQINYRDTHSRLSNLGRRQVLERFAIPFCNVLEGNRENIVKIYTSGRMRTVESADIIYNELKGRVEAGDLPQTRLLCLREKESLQTTDPISRQLANGSSPETATIDWQIIPEPVLNKVLGTISPRQMADRFDRSLASVRERFSRTEVGPDINLVLVTHETTIASIARKHILPNNLWVGVNYATSLLIKIKNGHGISYEFDNKVMHEE